MKVYRRIEEIDIQKPTVLSVGSFDGIHLGHQQILNELSKQSQDCNCLEVLVTFHPHPKIVVGSYDRRNIELLTTLEEKIQILERLDLPVLLVLPFFHFVVELLPLYPLLRKNDRIQLLCIHLR